ncbi:DUF6303 family protein [Streptomyces sp. NPDC006435]|uniref:DUF6303 family protein n=1 Tax=Streptomyces sp. NPDC006435 TaxID=3154300 RepID=UPI0033A6F65A
MLPQARMATGVYGTWELYVLVSADEWAKYEFRRLVPLPSPEERAEALAGLGYEAVDGAEWEWRELSAPTGPRLFAAIQVRPTGPGDGGAA